MGFLQGLALSLIKWLLSKGATLIAEQYKKYMRNKGIDDEVEEQFKAHDDIVQEIKEAKKNKEAITDEQRKRLREASRNLVGGTLK